MLSAVLIIESLAYIMIDVRVRHVGRSLINMGNNRGHNRGQNQSSAECRIPYFSSFNIISL